jgi:predicted acyltransferase
MRRVPNGACVHMQLQLAPSSFIDVTSVPTTRRIASVDALRGFNIFWILGGDGAVWALDDMLSNKGAVASGIGEFLGEQLHHVAWEGFTFYDFIFPLFIFVTGVAIVFSLSRLVEREGLAQAHLRVLRRALLLYGLGLIYYGGISQHWADIRYLGVLQRIGLCYLFASLMFLNLNLRGMIAAFVALLASYWALMTFVPVPGIGAGSFAPDANLANWIDAHYLPGRLWDKTRDPEGLLSTLPAIGTCLLGVFAGLLLKNERFTPQQRSLWLIGSGIHHQSDLDVVLRAGSRRLQSDPARRMASDHRRVGLTRLVDDLRVDRRQRHYALFPEQRVRLRAFRATLRRR